jgi:hypothetical protein
MGITGNILDAAYSAASRMPRILENFSALCIAAAEINPKSCAMAAASLNSPDPQKDVLDRINSIYANFTVRSFYDSINNATFDIVSYSELIQQLILFPENWATISKIFVELESAIQVGLRDNVPPPLAPFAFTNDGINTSIPLSSYPNLNLFPATICLDGDYSDIASETTFENYISKQIAENPMIGMLGMINAFCLTWPNLTTNDVERYRSSFPESIKNKFDHNRRNL